MKSPLLAFSLAGILLGCSEDPITTPLPGTQLDDLVLNETRSLIPIITLTGRHRAVFINADGAEKVLDLSFEEGVQQHQYQHFQYNTEYIQATYRDQHDDNYVPQLLARAKYEDLETHSESVTVTIQSSINMNFIPTLILCPEAHCAYLENYHDAILLAGLPFSRVYANWAPPPQFRSFTKVFYTLDQGIVGFEGYNGEVWALSRIE